MKKTYKKEVKAAFESQKDRHPEIITEDDLRPLPFIVQKYLRNRDAVGNDKVQNVRVEMEGRMYTKPGDPGMKIKSLQYNFFEPYSRFFYIKAFKMGIPAVGLHAYKDEKAIMRIKLAGMFTISDANGPKMDQGETVTVLNDMCFMAPGTLISRNIRWEIMEPAVVNAIFTNGHLVVSAILYFDDDGNLLNFISNDRFETQNGKEYKNYPWSTPVTETREVNGKKIPTMAKAIYHRPEGEFCYAEFVIRDIKYNCRELF